MSYSSNLSAIVAASVVLLAGVGAHAQSSSVQEVIVHPAAAAAGAETRSQTVSYADLDLDHDAGARALLLRINGAAKLVCSPEPQELKDTAPHKACVRQATDQAVADVGNPKLNALYHRGS